MEAATLVQHKGLRANRDLALILSWSRSHPIFFLPLSSCLCHYSRITKNEEPPKYFKKYFSLPDTKYKSFLSNRLISLESIPQSDCCSYSLWRCHWCESCTGSVPRSARVGTHCHSLPPGTPLQIQEKRVSTEQENTAGRYCSNHKTNWPHQYTHTQTLLPMTQLFGHQQKIHKVFLRKMRKDMYILI